MESPYFLAEASNRSSIECAKIYRDDVLMPAFSSSGPAALAQMRASGHDPAHGGDAAQRRGETNRKWAKMRAAWNGDLEKEKRQFLREIQPRLGGIPLSKIIEVTGFSTRYGSLIRKGEVIPHPVHYPLLEELIMRSDEHSDER